jgi:hypothetical protein
MLLYILLATFFLRCSNVNKPNNPVANTIAKESVLYDSVISSKKDSLAVFFKKDSVFFKHTNGIKAILSIPWSKKENYPSENLKGIYIVDKNALHKLSVIENKDLVYFTIFDELYRGQLYAMRFDKKVFLEDLQFKRNYLVSQSGIYIIDKQRNRIITVDKAYLDEKTNEMLTPLVVYLVKEKSFENLGVVKFKGELLYSDSLIILFYNKYQKANGKWEFIKN